MKLMNYKQHILILFSLILVSLGACDLYPQDEFQERYMVESYLVANRPLPQVRVSKTIPIDQEYKFSDAAVGDASVQVRLLNEAGGVDRSFSYRQKSPGIYGPEVFHEVIPTRQYQLHISFGNSSDPVTAKTIVPGQFETVNQVVDTMAYQDPRQVKITTTRSSYPDRQSFFIFNVEINDPDPTRLTPFYADQIDDDTSQIEDLTVNSSGIINEENYDQNEDGTLTLRLPWLAVAFYGPNKVITNAIDDNMYDFYRTQDVQGGGSTLPPGEYQNVQFNVEGGIGVFGSLASDTVEVFIRRANTSP